MGKVKKSLKLKYLLTLVCALSAAVICFFCLHFAGQYILDRWLDSSDYLKNETGKKAEELQEYVTEHNIAVSDRSRLNAWGSKQKNVYFLVFDGERLVYESEENDQGEYDEAEDEYSWQYYYEVKFSDGTANVLLFGMFGMELYVSALVIEIILSVLLFVSIFLMTVQKEINYIKCLEKEVKILETGGLDKEITLRGADELSSLAQGINQMRISLKENMELEEKLQKTNQRLVTGLSHDLRTPLTTLILYLEFLEGERYQNEKDRKKYTQKAVYKAQQLKVLSDQLFEQALVTEDQEKAQGECVQVQYALEDLISDSIALLESQGYTVNCKIEWNLVSVRANSDYLMRIMNNINTNLLKYADTKKEISITVSYLPEYVEVKFLNRISQGKDKEESTGVGIPNIVRMMEMMEGRCNIEEGEEEYQIKLQFLRSHELQKR